MAKATFRIWRGDAKGGDFKDYACEVGEGMVRERRNSKEGWVLCIQASQEGIFSKVARTSLVCYLVCKRSNGECRRGGRAKR